MEWTVGAGDCRSFGGHRRIAEACVFGMLFGGPLRICERQHLDRYHSVVTWGRGQ